MDTDTTKVTFLTELDLQRALRQYREDNRKATMVSNRESQEPGEDDRASLLRQREIHRRSLARLQEQKALCGMDVPTRLQNEIDYTESELRKIERQLQSLHVTLDSP